MCIVPCIYKAFYNFSQVSSNFKNKNKENVILNKGRFVLFTCLCIWPVFLRNLKQGHCTVILAHRPFYIHIAVCIASLELTRLGLGIAK